MKDQRAGLGVADQFRDGFYVSSQLINCAFIYTTFFLYSVYRAQDKLHGSQNGGFLRIETQTFVTRLSSAPISDEHLVQSREIIGVR